MEKLEKNIERFLQLREESSLRTPILRLSFCTQPDNIDERQEFLDKWKGKADVVDFQKLIEMDRVSKMPELPYKEYHCSDPFNRLFIDYDGSIYPCCSAGYCHYFHIGNIDDMSIMEAWHSSIIENLRNCFREQKINNICLNCSALF